MISSVIWNEIFLVLEQMEIRHDLRDVLKMKFLSFKRTQKKSSLNLMII